MIYPATQIPRVCAVCIAFLAPTMVFSAQSKTADAEVQRGLEQLIEAKGGPPGAIATLYRDGHLTVLSAGRADIGSDKAPQADQHMRIASITKAFSAAVALHLVQKGQLTLEDTIGRHLPDLPAAWSAVTIRQALNHTSGLTDYLQSEGLAAQVATNPQGYVHPTQIIDWIRKEPLDFTPGSQYAYSNTDNIIVGLISEAATGKSFETLLREIVFAPAGLIHTSFPTQDISLPSPYIHGYVVKPGSEPKDVTTLISPSGAWASGAIVSTPIDLGAFIRADLGLKFFDAAQQLQQMEFIPGDSGPPGPGVNESGLGLYKYTTPCGILYGHTGNFVGYTLWAASTADGKRSVTTTLNSPPPTGALLDSLRELQSKAVCALLDH